MQRRVIVQWTDTAKKQLAALPRKVRRGLLDKAGALRECGDPRETHKPLVGPLQGYYRITYARYRAVYSACEEQITSGDVLVYVRVIFVAVGKRKERDAKDIYRIAEKMVNLGLVDLAPPDKREAPDEA